MYREQKRLADQRMIVHHAAVRHAAAVSGVIHATSLKQVIREEEYHSNRDLIERYKRAEYERSTVLKDLSSALSSVDTLVDAKCELEMSLRRVTEKAVDSEKNLNVAENSLMLANANIIEMGAKMKAMFCEIDDLQLELKESTKTIETFNEEINSMQNHVKAEGMTQSEDLLAKLLSVEAELHNSRNACIAVSHQLVEAKTECAQLAAELVSSAEREDENREYIEDLQQQLASKFCSDDDTSIHEKLQDLQDEEDSITSSLSDYGVANKRHLESDLKNIDMRGQRNARKWH